MRTEAHEHHDADIIPAAQEENVVAPDYYLTLPQIEVRAKMLARKYPDLVRLEVVGKSGQGRDIFVLKINKNQSSVLANGEPKPRMCVMAGLHAREIANTSLVFDWLDELLANNGKDAEATMLLETRAIDFFPMVNPDGRERIDFGYKVGTRSMQRKTMADDFGEQVDPNRNGAFQWGGPGTGEYPWMQDYPGQKALSTPEMRSVYGYVDKVQASDHPFTFSTDVHSYSELILYPWGHTFELHPRFAGYDSFGGVLSSLSAYTSMQSAHLYPTSGTTKAMDGLYGIPHILLETGINFHQTDLEFAQVKSVVIPMLNHMLNVADAPLETAGGPELGEVQSKADGVVTAEVTLSPTKIVEGYRRWSEGVEKGASVNAIQYLDTIDGVTLGYAQVSSLNEQPKFSAQDGRFDEPAETVVGRINPDQIIEVDGRMFGILRARDSKGVWGPRKAFWVE